MKEYLVALALGQIQIDEDVAVRHLKKDLKDDWFPDPRGFEDMLDSGIASSILTENFRINHGQFVPGERSVFNIPKPNYTLRYGLETSISDRVLYNSIAAFLLPFYDPLIPWSVFSQRHASNDPSGRYLFKRAIPAWNDFLGVVRTQVNPQATLLSTDVSNYFENIDLQILKEIGWKAVGTVWASTGGPGWPM